MTKEPQLSRRERQILDILYGRGQATAEEVQRGLPDAPSYSAVRALLRIRRAEEARDVSEKRLQDILDNAPAVVHVKDLEGRYLLVNRRWEERFHRKRHEVIGRRPHDVFPADQADAFLANDRKVMGNYRNGMVGNVLAVSTCVSVVVVRFVVE